MPSFVIVEVGGVRAAVPAADVLEVVTVHEPVTVPGAPPFLTGLIGHRGAVVPLVDGAERVTGVRAPAGRAGTVVLVATSLGTVGLAVDRVVDLVRGDDVRGRRLDVEVLVSECRAAMGLPWRIA
jgi:chemotaxis signal transduction protein